MLKASWETKNCYTEDFFKTSWIHVLKTSWKHVVWRCSVKTQQTFIFQDLLKTSSRYVWKTSLTRLQHVFSVTIFRPSRHLKNISQDVLKTYSRRLGRRKFVTLKTPSRRLENMFWRRLGDKQNVYWGYLYLANLNVYLTNPYLTNLYLTNLRTVQMH